MTTGDHEAASIDVAAVRATRRVARHQLGASRWGTGAT